MNLKIKALLVAVGLIAPAVGATSAAALTPWDLHHPRRAEVNARLGIQNLRIHEARLGGAITPFQAFRLHQADRDILVQERRFALRDGGYITLHQQVMLNHEENGVSKHI
jgi:hypothetical protein